MLFSKYDLILIDKKLVYNNIKIWLMLTNILVRKKIMGSLLKWHKLIVLLLEWLIFFWQLLEYFSGRNFSCPYL